MRCRWEHVCRACGGLRPCRGVGDLVLVYKRVTALAGHTSRVAELLESVNRLSAPDAAAYHEQAPPLPPLPCQRQCTTAHTPDPSANSPKCHMDAALADNWT